jgi:hypothetical protein
MQEVSWTYLNFKKIKNIKFNEMRNAVRESESLSTGTTATGF